MMVDIFGDPVQNKKKSSRKSHQIIIGRYVYASIFYCLFLIGIIAFPILSYVGSLTAATFFIANAVIS
jgi:hypothetical protein